MSSLSSNLPSSFTASLRKLEFYTVLDRIKEFAVSESGQQKILQLFPSTDSANIKKELQKVTDAKEILIAEGSIPLDAFKDITVPLKRAAIENHILTPQELLDIAAIIRISRSLRVFLNKRAVLYPAFCAYHEELYADKIVEHHILETLDEHGAVKDSASKELREIRRSLISARETLHKRLESILRRVSEQEFSQEDIITTRDGRLVIPVKAEYKHNVHGFIHSTSASGATVFIEPAESLEFNNAVRELQLREQREIIRILTDMTNQVRHIREPLIVSFSALTDVDVVIARAKYSIEIIGNAPSLASRPSVLLTDARHPILLRHLKRESVIPLHIILGGNINTLIITGPNAGGKTVTLKTAGLLILCAQAGIHIPASPESEIYPFKNVFVDIGDDQSIENDLSTFSSHIIALRDILEKADSSSLVLIDEIGAGTDPSEGSSLAAVVLQKLTERKALTIATTHHGVLKAFAHETPGMSNASMEFDQESLVPTYRFRIGIPGSSYAFELAERLGISQDLLHDARSLSGKEQTRLESLLLELERQSQEYQTQLRETSREKSKLEALVLSYEQKTIQLKRELGTIRKKAVDEAKAIVQQAHGKVERSVKEIRESGARKEIIQSSRQTLKELGEELQKFSEEDTTNTPLQESIAIGDTVRIRDGSERGEVLKIEGNNALVAFGNARMRISLFELHKDQDKETHPVHPSTTVEMPAASNEIDLRGFYGDEAISHVQIFLDNAYASGLHRVDIIHGKGTGALRKRVNEFIQTYPHVKSFRLGEWNEGGTGVTVVELI